ncbi:MAG: DNA primase [Patescibacteria group bacterium]|nr:DNA primase [Patescibacteria group bacterium]
MANLSPIDEIKAKLDLVEIVSEYVRLTPAGINMKALCPFHKEKVPSFFVSPEKQIWKCFGCGKGGGLFDFIMEIEGVDFPQALRILAKKAGIILKTRDYHLTSKRTKLLDICREAAQYYHWYLLNAKGGESARKYLEERKISQKTIKEWQIGYAPHQRHLLYTFLTKKGFKTEDIEEAGLIVKEPTTNIQEPTFNYYDRFRGRIIFPVFDIFNQPVGFSGRILPSLEKEGVPKYINTPETLIYNKSRLLYGLNQAKLAIKKENFAILVEGNMDLLTAWQAGTKNVVATSGTALTLTQVKILKRYSSNLFLAFDLDPAGETATQRGIDIALTEEMNVKIIQLPAGKDPDECIRENKKLWFGAISRAQPIMEYYFSSAFTHFNPHQVEDQKKVARILLPIIAKIGNLIEQDFWLKKLAEKANLSYEILRESLRKINQKKSEVKEETPVIQEKNQELETQERFLGLLIKFPEQVSSFYEELDEEIFTNEKLKKILSHLKKCYSLISLENKLISYEEFIKDLDEETKSTIDFLILAIEKDFVNLDKKTVDKELEFLFKKIKKNFIFKKLNLMSENLKKAEKEKDQEVIKVLSEEVNQLTQQLKKYL